MCSQLTSYIKEVYPVTTEDILDMIDHTIEDYTSSDSMRWTPDPSPLRVDPRWRDLEVGDVLAIEEVRELLHLHERQQRFRSIVGRGSITSVDPLTGEWVHTPYVSPNVRPSA
jgi:predicted RNA-binding protein with PUA-like domain